MHFIELCKRFFLHITVFSFYYAFLELLIVLDRPISLKLHKPFSHKLLRLKERYIISWLKKILVMLSPNMKISKKQSLSQIK